MSSFWTDERRAVVLKHYHTRTSARDIAAIIGDGCTRNSVVGVARRMGLGRTWTPDLRSETSRKAMAAINARRVAEGLPPRLTGERPKRVRPPRAIKPKPAPIAPIVLLRRIAEAVPPLDMPQDAIAGAPAATTALKRTDCRWPIGDPQQPDFRYCCAVATPGKPYCAHHAAAAYTPATGPRKGTGYRVYQLGKTFTVVGAL